jgi:hypothetical protein
MSRNRFRSVQGLPAKLVNVIYAAEFLTEDGEARDMRSVAIALREFGATARWVLPVHGIFVPNNNDVSLIVQKVADQHLGLQDARHEFREALALVEAFELRDRIESAHGQVGGISDEAYFYAGIAFGLAFAE